MFSESIQALNAEGEGNELGCARPEAQNRRLFSKETYISVLAGAGVALYLLCRYILHVSAKQCEWRF